MFGGGRGRILAHDDAPARAEQIETLRALCNRRAAGVPVAYLLGVAEFYGREFVVNEGVLVPRPESEHLVDEALRFIRGAMRVLDVGTGCGAIACTIAAETSATIEATDISRRAIEIANENACRLGVDGRCRFHHGDLAEPVRDYRFDVIIANLPYIPTAVLPKAPDPASFEPRESLDGGPDGLTLYRRLLSQLPPLLNPGALVLLEAAPPTIDKLATIVRSTFPHFTISVVPDYAGLARYVKAHDGLSEGLRGGAAASEATRSPGGAGASLKPSAGGRTTRSPSVRRTAT